MKRTPRRKASQLTVTDLFCGAGGSSQGAELAGAVLRMGVNHWDRAVETHQANFPEAAHEQCDVSMARPEAFPPTDLLIASPECTNHSQAKGGRPPKDLWELAARERSRATMYDPLRFVEAHSHELVVIENVVDAARWGNHNDGAIFRAWLQQWDAHGYHTRVLFLNSGHFGAPQWRDRMYVVCWKKGNPAPDLEFRPRGFCQRVDGSGCDAEVECVQTWKPRKKTWPLDRWGKFRTQYFFTCSKCSSVVEPYAPGAWTAIDWGDLGTRIGDRERPLKPKTRDRIARCLERFRHLPPLVIPLSYGGNGVDGTPVNVPTGAVTGRHDRALVVGAASMLSPGGSWQRDGRPVTDPGFTLTAREAYGLLAHAAAMVTISGNVSERPGQLRAKPLGEPGYTQHTTNAFAFSCAPSIASLRGGGSAEKGGSSVIEPAGTVTAGGNHHGLIAPPAMLVRQNSGGAWMGSPVTRPAGTVTTSPTGSLVAMPFTSSYYGRGDCAAPVTDPTGAVTTVDRHALVTPTDITVDDCCFRMFKIPEIQALQAFAADYQLVGSQRDRAALLGNAVTPPVMHWILERAIATLRPDKTPRR